MSDLSEIQASLAVKLVGADSTGLETTPVNSTAGGGLLVNLTNAAGTEIGTLANPVRTNPTGTITTVYPDVAPATQNITALDVSTSSLVGANGQVFYVGTPTVNSSVSFAITSIEMVTLQSTIIGTGGTLVVEVSSDGGTFWMRPNVYQISTQNYTNGFTAPFAGVVNVTAMTNIRVRAITSWSGTATIKVIESVNSRAMIIAEALPTGANTIGAVTQSGTWNINLPVGAATETTLAAINTKTPAQGQTTMAASSPVVIASNQTSIPVTDSGGSLTVDGTVTSNQGTPNTSANCWPVRLSDGTDNALISINGDVQTADISNNGGSNGAITVGTSALLANVSGTNLTNRKYMNILNNGTVTIYWGTANTVTTANGMPIVKNQALTVAVGPNTNIYLISGTVGQNVRVVELA